MKIDHVTTRTLDLPNYRQETPDTCGPSAIRAVLSYYGIDVTEKQVVAGVNMDPEWGAEPDEMVRYMSEFGLQPEIRSEMTIEDLKKYTQELIPVIVVVQAWGSGDYENDWDDSHYVVVKSVGDEFIMFEDPSSDSESMLTIKEFKKRWHGWDYDIVGWGIVVNPGELKIDPVQNWIEKLG